MSDTGLDVVSVNWGTLQAFEVTVALVWMQTKYNSVMCDRHSPALLTKNVFVSGPAIVFNFLLHSALPKSKSGSHYHLLTPHLKIQESLTTDRSHEGMDSKQGHSFARREKGRKDKKYRKPERRSEQGSG